ncbi:hypothetical protein SAMN02745116_00713 [Pilibacter termitis]|uniref:Uncharacterized protein n=1 Tax=Pilibacter termitis TaxID=263852 RepID=A0A1T4LLU8_9ENTE|nr:hypothetical protein [Pilibacter termitis]SJZ55596.1 hypothetical protein SAMN02745116_00713 [Pilibacter termitis]
MKKEFLKMFFLMLALKLIFNLFQLSGHLDKVFQDESHTYSLLNERDFTAAIFFAIVMTAMTSISAKNQGKAEK